MRFQIEAVLPNSQKGAVIARQLDPGDFKLSKDALLQGIAIEPQVSAPRALHPDGTPRLDLFTFWLCSKSDLRSFSVGQVVELKTSPCA